MAKKILRVIAACLMGLCVIVYYMVTMPFSKKNKGGEENKS